MSRLLFGLAFLLTIILMLVALIGRSANVRPEHLAIRGFIEGCEDQPQPCWYGLVPEKTPFDEALQQLTNRGIPITKSPNVTDYPAATISADVMDCDVGLLRSDKDSTLFGGFYFHDCRSLTLGDILNVVGTPDSISTTLSCNSQLVPMSYYWMQYAGIGSVSLNATPDSWTWLSTSDPVVSFDFGGSAANLDLPKTWEGFIPFWRYNQLHPEQILSSRCGP